MARRSTSRWTRIAPLVCAAIAGCSSPARQQETDAGASADDGGNTGTTNAEPDGSPMTGPDAGVVDAPEAGAPQERCERYGAHVATCYNGSVSYYVGWCEWFLKGCPDAHIDKCVSSACADVQAYCGYC